MHGFDFISDSPKTFIFQKSSNKTNLGGVLTFIYLIIVILIFGSYILDYYLIENYEYSYFYKFIDDRENLKNSDINREVNFTIKLEDFDGNLMDEKEYIAFDSRDKNNSGTRININWKLDELNIYVLKKCKDERCIFTPKEILFPHYYYISYESLKIDLDNDDKPIQNQAFLRRIMFLPGNNTMKSCKGNWEIYSYKEVKGVEKIFDYLSGNKMNYTFGLIQEISCGNYFDNLNIVTKLDNTYYKYIFWFKLENPLNDPICPHYACKTCLDHYFASKGENIVPCPLCRRRIRKKNLVKVPLIEKVQNIIKASKDSYDIGFEIENCDKHPNNKFFYICVDCSNEIGSSKCYVCGGPKKGPGTAGATGPGVLCNKCYKVNTCIHCGEKINS